MKCTRCRREVRQPVYLGGIALGPRCAALVAGSKPRRAHVAPVVPDARQAELFEVRP